MQGAFQSCSHNLSTVAWDKIKDLQDSRRLAALEALGAAADGEGETNDILEDEERLDAVMKTWGDLVPNLELISDSMEEKFRTKVLPYTINTENGHCNKTMAILEYFDQLEPPLSFLVIVDDDTVLSVVRLAQLLGCYDKTESFLLGGSCFVLSCLVFVTSSYAGQKYGYLAALSGYNYITGGGGMVLTRSAVSNILQSGACRCPSPSDPDDMHLGRLYYK